MESISVDVKADRVYRQLSQLLRSYELCDQGCVSQLGVTASQGYVLLAFPEGASMSMNDLSQAMGLANSTMTRMVGTLVGKGLVYRRIDDADRRVIRVGLTARGEEVRRAVDYARRDLLRGVLLEVPEGEWHEVIHSLETLNGAIVKALKSCCTG